MVVHYAYNNVGQELLRQLVIVLDYSANMEAMGISDEINYNYYLFEYDNSGRKSHMYCVTKSYDEYYEYNDKNQVIKESVVAEGKGNSYVITREYDEIGNKIKEIQTFTDSGDEFSTEYKYDSAGKMVKDGKYTCVYDASGHMIKKYDSYTSWTYTYVSDPKNSRIYLDKVNNIINTEILETEAEKILLEQDRIISNKFDSKTEENDDVLNTEDFTKGGLPDTVFAEIQGHYDDGYGDTVDVESPTRIVRFITGGNQDHIYEEDICGYSKMSNGYMIYVEWDGEKYSYYYYQEDGQQKLSVNFYDEWNPAFENFTDDLQLYIKQENADDLVQETKTEDTDNPWGLDGANEGALPQNIFDILSGKYYSESRDITIEIISTTEVKYIEKGVEEILIIEGCDYYDQSLYIYLSGMDGSQKTFMIWSAGGIENLSILVGEGSWYPESFNIYAKKVD